MDPDTADDARRLRESWRMRREDGEPFYSDLHSDRARGQAREYDRKTAKVARRKP